MTLGPKTNGSTSWRVRVGNENAVTGQRIGCLSSTLHFDPTHHGRHRLHLLLLFSLSPSWATGSDADSVLMLGNSYTFSQDLPAALAQVFDAASHAVQIESLTSGGLTLADHANYASDPTSAWYEALVDRAADWNWVVLQDQSQIPGFSTTSRYYVDSLAAAESLNGLIGAGNAQTVFFMTWGYRDGDATNSARYPDYPTMQQHLTEGYLSYVNATSTEERPTWVAPVGLAYSHIYQGILTEGGDPSDGDSLFRLLYAADGSHPSPLGTYLAACVFYSTLSGESPVGLQAPKGMDEKWATALQNAAAATVFEETDEILYPWESNQGPSDPKDSGDTGRPTDSSDPGEDSLPADTAQSHDNGDRNVGDDADEGCGCAASHRRWTMAPWAFVVGGVAGCRRRRRTT